MGELHRNLIGGEWVGGEAVPNINPSDTNDVVGDYARRTEGRRAKPRSPRPRPRSRNGRARACSSATRCCARRRDEITRAQGRARTAAGARGRQDAGRRHRRDRARRADLRLLRRRGAAALRRDGAERAARHRRRDDARGGRRRRHHHAVEFPDRHPRLEDRAGALPTATPWSSSRPTWCPAAAWAIVDILHRAGLPKGVLNLVMGKGSVVGQAHPRQPRRQRHHLHRLGRHRHSASPRRMRRAHAQVPARDGRQEPAGRARRCRPRATPSTAPSTAPSSRPASAAPLRRGSSSPQGIHDQFVAAVTRAHRKPRGRRCA